MSMEKSMEKLEKLKKLKKLSLRSEVKDNTSACGIFGSLVGGIIGGKTFVSNSSNFSNFFNS